MQINNKFLVKTIIVLSLLGSFFGCTGFSKDNLFVDTVKKADEAYNKGDYSTAEKYYEEAMELDNGNFSDTHAKFLLIDRLASCYYEQGKFSEAEKLYKMKLEILQNWTIKDPDLEPLVYEQIGIFYANIKKCAEAKEYFQHALSKFDETNTERKSVDEKRYTYASILKIKGCEIPL